ncbi:helix-turn-helix domain-containing protein [Virgibacillus sp. 179-BFC.A HS]|uniref:Helix-turn-helix domain-containing protein n=1 Tax=Tigheibacillus jepli TaxID=3035914 RepID=A0ABU5CJI3_9BACI|nr:helix-turn-helix domain-containing protein [Virgibacillus sp. 179-BFC.A HS]MDY0406503.1 helix-turn-helix domain-containing protein [Virgibacillus sp. 179-BFC.A HS]
MTQQIDHEIIQSIKDQLEIYFNKINQHQEWLDLKSAAKYANVSYNTFIKFRQMGLKVAEVDGVKRVKKSEIDRFLQEHSF